LFYYINIRKNNSKRVLIFAQGRTGSTLLEDLLCSTSYFNKRGEILAAGTGSKIKYPYQYVNGLSNIKPNKNFIFHLKIYQLTNRKNRIEPADFLNKMKKNGWEIIYLKRRNKLNQVLSNEISVIRKSHQKYDDSKEDFSIRLDPVNVKTRIERRTNFEHEELRVLQNIDCLKLVYEDDLLNPNTHQQTVNKILDYLGLERRQCYTTLRKVNKSKQKDVIENYDEVINYLEEHNLLNFVE
jgi:LPS sulfotransferase NodH